MNRLYKNSLLYLVANIAVKAATFLLVPFYSYLITPSEYGYIYIVVSFVSFMSLFVTCSLHGAITRFYWECKDINEIQKMFSTITYIVLFLSFIVATTMLFFSELISDWLNLPIIYLKIAIFSSVFTCFDHSTSLYETRGKKNFFYKYWRWIRTDIYSIDFNLKYEG